ncbi:hypothetical protein HNY73_004898 [Argiope bruennichi]|uniref:Uncharacterized protein n=1 Tax=Argiope bruennichi TaxID=94029 RepID=A0A8T0FRG3_ARGBR|nr:hypothetical protein HNY73_004898 [Argiope bruennichi]
MPIEKGKVKKPHRLRRLGNTSSVGDTRLEGRGIPNRSWSLVELSLENPFELGFSTALAAQRFFLDCVSTSRSFEVGANYHATFLKLNKWHRCKSFADAVPVCTSVTVNFWGGFSIEAKDLPPEAVYIPYTVTRTTELLDGDHKCQKDAHFCTSHLPLRLIPRSSDHSSLTRI